MARRRVGVGWSPAVRERIERRDRFHRLVADALDSLPPEIAAALENVEVVIEDEGSPGVLGLYEGIPQPDRDAAYSWVLPDVITIYRAPIEARVSNEEELAAEVRTTVLHEIAHHFGISDERLREIDRY